MENEIIKVLLAVRTVEEKFRKIQENPALNGAENGFTAEENKLIGQLIDLCGEVNIAGDAILKRYSL